MPEMTKQDFAIKLLFWLLPWPMSRALPRSLRIYYYGPAGLPSDGWHWMWGRWVYFGKGPATEYPLGGYLGPTPPADTDIDPYSPPPPDQFPEPGTEPDAYIDMDNPPPPDQFPEPPSGPDNFDDPYTPGPGPDGSPPDPDPDPGTGWYDYVNYRYWLTPVGGAWQPATHSWKAIIGEVHLFRRTPWTADWRPTHFRIEHSSTGLDVEVWDTDNNDIVAVHDYVSMAEVEISYEGNDLKGFGFNPDPGDCFSRIEFFGPYMPNDE